jgi:hypothetical protein
VGAGHVAPAAVTIFILISSNTSAGLKDTYPVVIDLDLALTPIITLVLKDAPFGEHLFALAADTPQRVQTDINYCEHGPRSSMFR